jgi:ABC-type transport system involved in multi-copper enzyme maturation permease subunit
MNPRVRAVIRKELREYRRNKFVIGTMVALPLLFLILPLGSLISIKPDAPAGAIKALVGSQSLTMFLVPLILPTVIAAYALIGEREQGTLEPVLTTPIRHQELLLGKALAAVIPTVAVSYALFGAFVTVIRVAAAKPVVNLVWQPSQIVAILLFAPLVAAFSIWVGLAISVRAVTFAWPSSCRAWPRCPCSGSSPCTPSGW